MAVAATTAAAAAIIVIFVVVCFMCGMMMVVALVYQRLRLMVFIVVMTAKRIGFRLLGKMVLTKAKRRQCLRLVLVIVVSSLGGRGHRWGVVGEQFCACWRWRLLLGKLLLLL